MNELTEKRLKLLSALSEANVHYRRLMGSGFLSRLHRFFRFPIKTFIRAWQIRVLGNNKNRVITTRWFFGGRGLTTSTNYDSWYVGALCAASEMETARFILQRLGTGAAFFDVGSHHGYYSLLAHQLLGDIPGTIVAFEPSPFHFKLLCRNVENTGIVAEQIALGSVEGTVPFYESRFGTSTLHVSLTDRKKYPFKQISVRCESLDRYCERTGRVPDIMKADIEGNEYAFLCGARSVIARAKPDIIMEVWGGVHAQTYRAAATILLECGYIAYRYNGDMLLPIHDTPSFLPQDGGIRNIFFVHPSKTGEDSITKNV